ncbi:MAG: VWA domain-containing protein [Treponema sp.]|jgi:Ca-activated chloride channel family protein|nr:VWA domain-containing protein [Treponema sp.]
MSFEQPLFLWALLIVIPMAVFAVLRRRGRGSFRFRRLLSAFFFQIFFACLVVALAGPRWGSRAVREYRRGLDAVFAVDVSRSMGARDIPGSKLSRLDRGLEVAGETAAMVEEVRYAAAVSRGRGLLTVPLTRDTESLLNFLGAGSALTGRGTNLEALVDAAMGAFVPGSPGRKAIVLISDGEALSGSLGAAAGRARAGDVTLIALGVGGEAGAELPAADQGTAVVISRRREGPLRQAAEHTGGVYIDGNRKDAASLLAEQLRSMVPGFSAGGIRREPAPRWDIFISAALAALGLSKLVLSGRRGRARLLPVLLACLGAVSCSRISGRLLVMEGNFFSRRGMMVEAIASYLRAREYDEAFPYAEYGLGSVYAALDEGALALDRFAGSEEGLLELSRMRKNPAEYRELQYRIRYNTGVVLFGQRDFAGAAAAFRGALEIDGSRIDAKRNLELSLLSLAAGRPEADGFGTGQGDGPEQNGGDREAREILFEYLRRKETNQWQSREWTDEEVPAEPDY